MPERLPYDEAMLFSSIRLKVQDPEIKQGKVETVKVQTQVGVVERPWGVEGGFAVVYKFRTRSGQFRALRCFRVPMDPDTQFRYEQIGPYFHAYAGAITAGFKYHDCGIVVKEQGKPQGQTYPIIEMDWIDGVILVDKVDELCRKRDRATLRKLSEQWVSILYTLHNAQIAHGDLAGPNIMVRSDERLVLIDYDGTYVPSFAGKNQILLGQPDYQHPQMAQRKFDEHMDAFSALVIYIALLALTLRPELWSSYTVRDEGKLLDTNLMFKQKDFQDPQHSLLFRELAGLGDQHIKVLVQELKRACTLPVEQVRFPFHLLDPDHDKKQTLELLKQAVAAEDDELIVKLWTSELSQHQLAQSQRSRVQLAQRRVKALSQWRDALKKGNIARIVSSYSPVLDGCKNVTQIEKDLLVQARQFLRAYNGNDDAVLLSAAEILLQLSSSSGITFTAQEEQRIMQVRQRRREVQQVKAAIQSNAIATIAAAYTPFQRIQSYLLPQECQMMELAYKFLQAYKKNDDSALLTAFDAIQRSAYRTQLHLSQQEERRVEQARDAEVQRIEQARHIQEALARLRAALASRNLTAIVAAYDPILDDSKDIAAEERSRIALARLYIEADKDQNDDDLVSVYDRIQNSPHRHWLTFTPEEEQRVKQAKDQRVILEKFRKALKSKQPRLIASVYYDKDNQPLLSTSKSVTPSQRELARLAGDIIQSLDMRHDDRLLKVYEALQQSPHKDALDFTQDEQRYIREIGSRKAVRTRLEQALDKGTAADIDTVYAQMPSEVYAQLTSGQRNKAESAKAYLEKYRQLQDAIHNKNVTKVIDIYKSIINHPMLYLLPDEQQYVDRVMKFASVIQGGKDGQVIAAAREFLQQGGSGLDGFSSRVSGAVQRLSTHELEEIDASIRKNRNTYWLVVRWYWPQEEQIRDAIIIYSFYALPPIFRELKDVDQPYRYSIRRMHESAKQEEILLERSYIEHGHTSLFLRVCVLMSDNYTAAGKHYLSPGVTRQVDIKR